ncbi:transposase, partial [Coraliomargarita sp. SDUM461004]
YRLYLPEAWTQDCERMDRAHVPADKRTFKTKPELAWEIIENAINQGLEFNWVGMDSLYGSNSKLLAKLEEQGLRYVADVRSNQKFYVRDASGALVYQRVDRIWIERGGEQAEHVHFRNATKGPLHAQVLRIAL